MSRMMQIQLIMLSPPYTIQEMVKHPMRDYNFTNTRYAFV